MSEAQGTEMEGLDLSQLSDLALDILSFFDDGAKAWSAKRVCKAAYRKFKDSKCISLIQPEVPLFAVQELYRYPALSALQ